MGDATGDRGVIDQQVSVPLGEVREIVSKYVGRNSRIYHYISDELSKAHHASLSAQPQQSAEDMFEEYVASLIDKAPNVQRLASRLADLLDDDDFNNVNAQLLALSRMESAQPRQDEVARLVEAARPFATFNSSEPTITVRTPDIRRLRASLAPFAAMEATGGES